MNQDTRNKKNAKYQQNLQKRYGLTKSSDYKAMCSKGISLSENIKPMTKEFVTTRRHDKIVSREVYTYKWTPEATNARKEYHETKEGIAGIPKKPVKVEDIPGLRKFFIILHIFVDSLNSAHFVFSC